MPAAVSQSIRDALWIASQQGMSTAALSERFQLPGRTVRHLLQQGRATGGPIPPVAYHTVGPPDLDSASEIFRYVWRVKEQHPDWGARFLLGVLAKAFPNEHLPSERTLRRWLRRLKQPAAPAGRRSERLPRAQAAHQRWQIDACDQMPLANQEQISWLRGVDECTGTVLGTLVFPPGAIRPGAARTDPGAVSQVV
jgi:transposase